MRHVPEPGRSLAVLDATRIVANLRTLFDGHRLSPSQRRIARYLLDNAQEAVFFTSADLAARAGVSQPSVTRFAAALGFRGFPEFREALRTSVFGDRPPVATDDRYNEIQELVDSEIRDLERLRDGLADPGQLRRVAAQLARSSPLLVMGLRISAPLAHLFGYLAEKVLPDVRVLDVPGSILEDRLSRAAESGAAWVLAIGLPRYPRELEQGLVWARRVRLKVALVTDQPVGRLTDLADEVLLAPVSSGFAFDSHAGPTVLCTALLHTMLDTLAAEGQARLEAFDDRAAERQVFFAG
ncbi:MurR/RpiR family transcriptional regulator [Microbispora catharanthi]|uniref:MurR/RpiR family transcriptional regulator n=1 Tax=Microbispora catharanthi TaxID=1712871 RepID=A0A5N6BKF0_9ACTN|nr:MurR/RpiR family transcriptional regulator [Microbispora catharanthi]KAB8180925.1 MurR/RpiR family transcriptional regulator [Microbispora catharanthi]